MTVCWRYRMIAFFMAPALLLSGCAVSQSDTQRLGNFSDKTDPVFVSLADAQKSADIRLQLAID